MMLAGLPVRDQDVLELARLLRDAGFDDTAEKLAWDVECTAPGMRSARFAQRALPVSPARW